MTLTADPGPGTLLSVDPSTAGWQYLSFAVIELPSGGSHRHVLPDQETALVPLSGQADVTFAGSTHRLGRASVFDSLAPVVYAPPGVAIEVAAAGPFTFAIGSAPAEGRYEARVIDPSVIRTEVRGGGTALRHVNHTLAAPIEAERLILYEVYVPRGTWSGWAPHRHDGVEDSPYLEETYYFRLDRPEGFWIHRNWDDDDGFDQLLHGGDGDCALVPRGWHSSVACPGANMYFLNYLAGELIGDERATPPCFHSDFTWIHSDWEAGAWRLPMFGADA